MQNDKPSARGLPASPANDLRAKYNLGPQPIGVQKISGLVKGRASASMEEITEIINTDSGITQRLISQAYPRQAARLGATVQMATSRLGINRVIVVMVGDLLTKAIIETFSTMAGMDLQLLNSATMSLGDHGYLTGTVRFDGETTGQVTIAFSPIFSMGVAAHLLGSSLDDELSPEAINDVIGELVNIITGNLQSKLSDSGLPSTVGLPQVAFQSALRKEAVSGGSSDFFYFSHGVHTLVANLSIDPSSLPKPASGRAPATHGNSWRANAPR
jgi:CheY-specific phosphatase CheX